MIDTEKFYDELIKNDIGFFAGVPDSLLKNLCSCIESKTLANRHFITANEGNAVAMCAGWHLATGKFGMVYMQNSGEGNAINPLVSLVDEDVYNIPLLLIIGWRGEPGVHDEPQHVKQGKVTIPILDSIGLKHLVLNEDYVSQVRQCVDYMNETGKPVAIIVQKNIFSPFCHISQNNNSLLTREQSLEILLSSIGLESFIVSSTGKSSREIFEIRERNNQSHSHDFLTVGSMGHTASIACGMAVGTNENIYCIDGDGSFLMHMGSLPVIAEKAPQNLKYILMNNGSHESVGGQPTVALKIDCAGILKASHFEHVLEARTENEIRIGIEFMSKNKLCAMIIYCEKGSRDNLGRPTTTPIENKKNFMRAIKQRNAVIEKKSNC